MELFGAALLPFLLALTAPLFHRLTARYAGWIYAAMALLLALQFARTGASTGYQAVLQQIDWVPSLGVRLSFRLDGLSLLFVLLIAGIGSLIFVYSGAYLKSDAHLHRFYALMLFFMGSMLGVVLADNIIVLFVFWELTSVASYLLIGFHFEREEVRKGALQALLVTSAGGLCMLAGLILLGQAGGSYELTELLQRGQAIRAHASYPAIFLLVALGAFTKSAQFPFHFWLPSAMEAPTPATAYLHSATMVKAGIYLLARLYPVLAGGAGWFLLLTCTGAATMLAGSYLALTSTDLKRILAYTTVSGLGIMTFLLGVGTPLSVSAAIVFLLAHALYKASLFLIAGAVDHGTGTRDLRLLGGLYRSMPVTACAAVLAALSLAGFGPLVAFIAKEMALEAALESERGALLAFALVLTSVLLTAAACLVSYKVFFGAKIETPSAPHEAPFELLLGPLSLSCAGLVFGVAPALLGGIAGLARASVLGPAGTFKMHLWHGWNSALMLSLISLALGLLLFRNLRFLQNLNGRIEFVLRAGPACWYDCALAGTFSLAKRQTDVLQNGHLRLYIATVLLTLVGLGGYSTLQVLPKLSFPDVRLYEAALAVIILAASFAAVRAKARLAAVAFVGVVGYAVAVVFALYGAPDLAMTQFTIETLVVLLFVLVLYRLPNFAVFSPPTARARDAACAAAVGVLITLMVLVALQHPAAEEAISSYFIENSHSLAHGRNIVNVILVDFRGFDTLGEITVLSTAAVGVYALLKLWPKRERSA